MSPTPERWAQIKSIFTSASELSPPERSSFMQQACGDDLSLIAEVESLLEAGQHINTLPNARAAVARAATQIQLDQNDSITDLLTIALGHQYEIIREIGRGGMGAVYLAREKALERLVAIKVLRPELAASPESRERFRREARIAANLSHPAILQLHTFGEVSGVWYFVMSYIRGESLAELLRRRNRLPWPDAHRLLTELSDALVCAHEYHVVHRDIKPANILIEANTGRAVLADFGISKIFGSDDPLTKSGMVVGTPEYMSPEQTMPQADVDERSDIYSLGSVGYTMLCGRPPYAAENVNQLMYAKLSKDPAPLSSVNPSVPDDLAAAVMKCLSRDRAQRWQTATSLRNALAAIGEKAVDGLPEGIRDIPSFGPYALAWFIGWLALALLRDRPAPESFVLIIAACLVPMGLLLHVWLMGGKGIGLPQLLRVALRPPEWWSMYWPRTLRRPSDLWTRLPLPARLFRIVGSAFFMVLAAIIITREFLTPELRDSIGPALGVTEVAAVVLTLATLIAAVFWARQRLLSAEETARMLIGPTAFSSGWTTPRLTRLLAPAGGSIRAPMPDDPADFARAIREAAAILPSELAQFRLIALDLADKAAETLARQGDDVDSMQRDAGPSESDRLQLRIAALGPETVSEPKQRSELRYVLQHELALVWQMRDRAELAARQYTRRFELLRNLHAELWESCSNEGVSIPAADRETRLMSVCTELRCELEAPDA